MSIDTQGADLFFRTGNHRHSRIWNSFKQEDREAGIADARRMISRDLGITLDDNETAYAEGDLRRDEYAVYEQALHMLVNTMFPNEEGSGPAYQAETETGVARLPDGAKWSRECKRWLGLNGQVQLSRG